MLESYHCNIYMSRKINSYDIKIKKEKTPGPWWVRTLGEGKSHSQLTAHSGNGVCT